MALLGWCAALCALALTISEAANLKYAQALVWPTDLYAFQQIETGPIDVALIGSSRTTFGLAPTAIDSCLQRARRQPSTTYNLSRVFASMSTERIVARDLLDGERVPRVAVIEVAPETLAARHHEHTYNTASQVGIPDLPGCITEARSIDDLTACSRAPFRGVENLAWLISGERSDINHLRWMMLQQRGGQWCFGSPVCAAHNQRFATVLKPRWQMRLDRVLPNLTEERFGDWSLGEGQGHEALVSLIEEADERGYELLLLNMPVHQLYLDEIPEEAYAEYLAYLDEISREFGVKLHDANSPSWNAARQLYHDPDHLNAAGALQLSNELCGVLTGMLET